MQLGAIRECLYETCIIRLQGFYALWKIAGEFDESESADQDQDRIGTEKHRT